ncbi:MAG: carbohydrate kinase family protein [Anaerolineales bacterium]|nr:carbohydrate kinase family protein [Anaerolineales bacterium]
MMIVNNKNQLDVVVVGNVTLDVVCYPVEEVPRYESIGFDDVKVSPGGCGSNTAIGLAALGVDVGIVTCVGDDDTAGLLSKSWERIGVDTRFVKQIIGENTGVSVGLIDQAYQPRFIHTSGANAVITPDMFSPISYAATGAKYLHIAGYFVLPGLYDDGLADVLAEARDLGIHTSLDVVTSPRMEDPSPLIPCLQYLDVMMCNKHEAYRLTESEEPARATAILREMGAHSVIVKLGEKGCWVDSEQFCGQVPALVVPVLDTTGAGDAFAAGFLAAKVRGAELKTACQQGNLAGARVVQQLGAVEAWFLTD